MLAEVRQIRKELASLSDSARDITKAIEAVLGDEISDDPDHFVEHYEAGIRNG
jgi:hypothetical protein